LSEAYLFLNAASYDGTIWHADVYQPCTRRAGFYAYKGCRYENIDIFPKMRAGRPTLSLRWPQVRLQAVGLYQPAGWLAGCSSYCRNSLLWILLNCHVSEISTNFGEIW